MSEGRQPSSRARWLDRVRSAVELDLPYRLRPRAQGTVAGVLVLLSEPEGDTDSISVLLTRRTESVEKHKGQIAFPGGVRDPKDEAGGGIVRTALRETEEEVGISPSAVEVVGRLPDLSTSTGFVVTPVVAVLAQPLQSARLVVNPAEIAEAFWVSLSVLRSPKTYREERFLVAGREWPIDAFQVGRHRIWGATGTILRNFLDRLERVG